MRSRTDLALDVHLQVEQPERYLDALIEAKVDMVSIHVEGTVHLSNALLCLKSAGVKACVVINPATPLVLLDEVLDRVDQVTVMTSNPGTSDFIPSTLSKIERLRRELKDRKLDSVRICADGGVTRERSATILRAGADSVIAASAVFGCPDGVLAAVEALSGDVRGK